MLWLMPLKRYFQFYGRSGRAEFWQFVLFFILALTCAALIDTAVDADGPPTFIPIVFLGLVNPGYALSFRRLHDRNLPGSLLGLLLMLNGIYFTLENFRRNIAGTVIDIPFAILSGATLLLTAAVALYILVQISLPGDQAANQYGAALTTTTDAGPGIADLSTRLKAALTRLADPVSRRDPLSQLEQLARLRREGVLSEAEFECRKAVILGGTRTEQEAAS